MNETIKKKQARDKGKEEALESDHAGTSRNVSLWLIAYPW